jgi:hypothetical protein
MGRKKRKKANEKKDSRERNFEAWWLQKRMKMMGQMF